MERLPPSRMNILAGMALAMGLADMGRAPTTAEILRKHRGPAPAGKKFISGVYIPGGPHCNVSPTRVKNPKIAAQMQAMHEKWLAAKIARVEAAMAKVKEKMEANGEALA